MNDVYRSNTYVKKIPKSTLHDFFTGIACFVVMYFLPLFLLYNLFDDKELYGVGIGFGLFLCALPVYLLSVFYVKKDKKGFNGKSVIIFLCYTVTLISFVFNSEFILTVIKLPLFVYLTGAFCALKSNSLLLKDDTYRFITHQLRQIFVIPVSKVYLPYKSLVKSVHIKADKKTAGIIAGCVLSLPVVVLVSYLLSSGDAAFSNATYEVFSLLGSAMEKIVDYLFYRCDPFEIFIGLFSGFVFSPFVFSALFCFRHRIQKELQTGIDLNSASHRFVEPNVAVGFFAMICVLYVLYLFSQLSYFFGAFSGKIPLAVNMSLSEYARRGFFEMSAIAVINLLIIAFGVVSVKRKEDGRISPLFKGIFTFLCLFTLLLIVTAISKMALYITEMGLTHKRILVCIIDLLLTVILICVLARLYREKFPYMKIIFTVTLCVLSFYCLIGDSALIADFNTNAYIKGYHKELDIETIYYETDALHAAKNLRGIAENKDDKMSTKAYEVIGWMIFDSTNYLPEKKLEMNSFKNFVTSENVSDFFFWEYAKDNRDYIMKALNTYRASIDWQGDY